MVAPKLRFKEFDGDWDLKNLGDCFSLFSGYAFPSSASVDNGTKWLKIADVGIQEMTPNNLSFLPNNFTTKFPQFIVYKNDYVIALTRPILNKKLKISKVGEFYDGALLNQRVAKIVTENNNLDFIYSLLQKSKTVEELENSIAGTDPPNLSLNEVKGIILGIPKIQEQTKIASFLSNVDEKVSQLTQKHALLSQYKQGMMQKLFSQQMRFKADDGSEFGEWEEVALSEIAVITMGSSPKSENYNEILNGLPLLQGNADIKNRKSLPRIYTSEITRKCNVGDILLSVRAPVGFVATSEHYACIGRGLCSIKANPNYLQGFIYQWLLSKENSWGSLSQGSTFESVNSDQIKNLSIQIPCLEEQTKIANFLSSIDQKIEVVAQQIEQAKQWKKGLLQQMFV